MASQIGKPATSSPEDDLENAEQRLLKGSDDGSEDIGLQDAWQDHVSPETQTVDDKDEK